MQPAVTHGPLPGLSTNAPPTSGAVGSPGRDTMHPLFKELFIQTDADDLLAEKDRRRRVRRSRRARTAMVIKPAARPRPHQPQR